MSRRGRGGRRTGPDLSWEDEPVVADSNKKPEPLFPELNPPLSVPKPLSKDETERVNDYLTFRETLRNGPLYAVLKTNSFTDDKGRVNARAGFDPFTGFEKYSARFEKPKRTVPDLSNRTFHLPFFPRELWSTLDPTRQSPAWRKRKPTTTTIANALLAGQHTSSASTATPPKKRKRATSLLEIPSDDDEGRHDQDTDGDGDEDDDDDDAPIPATKRRKRSTLTKKRKAAAASDEREKSGLEAEDDIPDVDNLAGGAGGDEDDGQGSEVSDHAFSDDEGGDYAAEDYFDDDMGDEGGGGFGDGDDGGGGEGTFD